MQTRSGRHPNVASDSTLELSADDAEPFIRSGWPKLGECILDPDLFDDEQITETVKPEGSKVYAKGSMEWQREQEEQESARIAAEEEKEKRRLARVAAMRGKAL